MEELVFRLAAFIIARGREVRHQTFQLGRRGLHGPRDLLGAGARAQAAHAAVDLQMIRTARGRQVLQGMNYRRQLEFFQAAALLG